MKLSYDDYKIENQGLVKGKVVQNNVGCKDANIKNKRSIDGGIVQNNIANCTNEG